MVKDNNFEAASDYSINLNVKIQRHEMDNAALQEFIQARDSNASEAQGSIAEYVKSKFYSNQDIVVIPDFGGAIIRPSSDSNQFNRFKNPKELNLDELFRNHFDLSAIDFTGCNMRGANFENCNLEGAILCETDLSDVTFNDCYMPNADLRGADLSNCRFMEKDVHDFLDEDNNFSIDDLSKKQIENITRRYKGLHFSFSEPLMHEYAEANKDIHKQAKAGFYLAKDEIIKAKEEKLSSIEGDIIDAYNSLSFAQRLYSAASRKTGNVHYDKLIDEQKELTKEIQAIKEQSFKKDFDPNDIKYMVHPSVVALSHMLNDTNSLNFDPAYVRGSTPEERQQLKQYVKLSREDAEKFIQANKEKPGLSINDYAKDLMANKGVIPVPGAKIIADFSNKNSGKEGESYIGEQINLSDLDFSQANLKDACFAGTNLNNCKFNNANLSRASFEGAEIGNAEFTNVKAKDTNFFYCDLRSAKISSSDFERAFMRGSDASECKIDNTNFNFSNIRHGKWDQVDIEKSQFEYAELEGVSLIGARLKQVNMQHALLDKAIMNNCEIIESDFTKALMTNVEAKKAKIKDAVLKDVDATNINLTEAEINHLSKLDGADLTNAVMDKVKADKVNFVGTKMEGVKAELASFEEANFENVNMRFAKLEGAVLDGVKAAGIDLTGAELKKIQARKAELNNSIMEGAQALQADFTGAVLEQANLRGINLQKAILKEVEAKKADLRNADLEAASISGNIEGAKVNAGTNFAKADMEAIKDQKLINEDNQGKESNVSVGEKQAIDNHVHEAKQKSWIGNLAGKALNAAGSLCSKAAAFIKQPLSGKWGAVIGGALGVAAVAAFAATAVATAGLSIPITIAIGAGICLAGGGIGATIGYFVAKKSGLTNYIAGAAGAITFGPGGAAAGLAAGAVANGIVKSKTGNTIDENIAEGVEYIGDKAKAAAHDMIITEEQEKLLKEHKDAKKAYIKPEREQSNKKGKTAEDVKLANKVAKEQNKIKRKSEVKQNKYEASKVKPTKELASKDKTSKKSTDKSWIERTGSKKSLQQEGNWKDKVANESKTKGTIEKL
ncbi:MAG: spkB [Rickettsiaceae bacterium]|jgi:uncharacterized protein YjbI with pentapeptide repeats|nr:spkB [Rickettsiaceae bacterium]